MAQPIASMDEKYKEPSPDNRSHQARLKSKNWGNIYQ